MDKMKELKQEADDLGIKYSPNIGEGKLQEKVDAYYESQETTSKVIEEAVKDTEAAQPEGNESMEMYRKKRAAKREQEARKTKVITIIDNDQRVNNQTTSCTVTCGNEYFDLSTMILPLNTPVEVMQGHINVLKDVQIPQHVKNPQTGLSEVKIRKRYTISYEENQPAS